MAKKIKKIKQIDDGIGCLIFFISGLVGFGIAGLGYPMLGVIIWVLGIVVFFMIPFAESFGLLSPRCPNCNHNLGREENLSERFNNTDIKTLKEQYLGRQSIPGTPPSTKRTSDVYWNTTQRKYQRRYEGQILTIPGSAPYDVDIYEVTTVVCCIKCKYELEEPRTQKEERNITWHWPQIE
jgi:hypothetical protein